MLPAFKRIPIRGKQADEVAWELNKTAENVATALGPVLAIADLDKSLVRGIALVAATPKAINHKLQRQPEGWRVTDVTGGELAIQRIDWDRNTITLQNAFNVTLSIEVW